MGFCISGSLRASIRIERTGYVPGENILFSAEIDNESGAKIKGSKVQLIEVKFLAIWNVTVANNQ